MKLYHYPPSSYSQKVLVACYEKSIEFEGELVYFLDQSDRVTYRKIYPIGKIPYLVLDDGEGVPESTNIIEVLDTHFDTGPKLIPDDREISRQVRFRDRMYDLYLTASVSTLIFENWKPEPKRNQKRIEKSLFYITTMYDFMEDFLADQTWSNGEEFTLGDCAAAAPLFYARKVAPYDDRPNITAYWQRLEARPSVHRALDDAAPFLAALEEIKAP